MIGYRVWSRPVTRRSVLFPLLGIGLVALLGVTPAPASQHIQARDYIAGFVGDTDVYLCNDDPANPTGAGIGAVCFEPQRKQVSMVIEDVTQETVAGFIVFLTEECDAVGSATDGCGSSGVIRFCGESPTTIIPQGTAQILVYIGGPALGSLECLVAGPQDSFGVGTVGTVTATFTN